MERRIADARNLREKLAAAQNSDQSGLAPREVADARVAALLAGSIEPDEVRDIIAEGILARFPRGAADGQNEGEPVGVPELDRMTVELLRNPTAKPPAPTFQDARELYLKDKLNGGGGAEHHSSVLHLDRVSILVKEALGGYPALNPLRREHARKVRDHMLAQRKKDGKPISPASVQRNLTLARSVINYALRELDLKGKVHNPFAELSIEGAKSGRGNATTDADKRLPLASDILKEVRARVVSGRTRSLV